MKRVEYHPLGGHLHFLFNHGHLHSSDSSVILVLYYPCIVFLQIGWSGPAAESTIV